MAKQPRNGDLPGMENREIAELEDVGAEYADVRDRRMELTKEEKDLKERIRALMHKHKRTRYESAGIEITLVPPDEEDKVLVKLRKPKELSADEQDDESDEEHVVANA
jgi:hypothetical protein